MSVSLVILAAGLGTRFGGDKPLAAVGPNRQSMFEYSVHDAVKAGFTHVIFVVNAQQDTAVFSKRLKCYGDSLKVEFVVQSKSAYITSAKMAQYSDRTKPWGTAHAVLACRDTIHNPFVVINADDYYGQNNYKIIRDYLLANSGNSKTCVLPGYRLENTMSSSGGVNRGICQVDSDGFLESIREIKNISYGKSMTLRYEQYDDHCDAPVSVKNASIVSMTFWGFVPSIFDLFKNEFQVFLNETADPMQDEFYIPDTVNLGIAAGLIRAKVFDTSEQWKGLTYAEDLSEVRGFVSHLTETGVYTDVGSPKPSGQLMINVATALLFDSDGKLLIYLRDDKPDIPFPNCWDLFGGHVEKGETPEEALVREVQEELGIHIENYNFFKTYQCMEGDAHPNIKHVFVVQITQAAADLTLYEGQYHKGIELDQRHQYQFANILGDIIDDFVAVGL